MSSPECRVLLLAPNWLGDLVMTTPLLSWLGAVSDLPDGRRLALTLGVRRRWAPLFVGDGRVAELLVIARTGRHAGARGLVRLARECHRRRFDAVLVAPPSLRGGLVAWLAGIPVRVGYRSDGRRWLLTRSSASPPRGRRHFSAEMLDLGRMLLDELAPGWEPEEAGPGPRIGLDALADPIAEAVRGPYWVLAPGTTYGEAKNWPAARVGEFLELALRQRGVSVLLVGDAQGEGFVARLRRDSRLPWREELGPEPGVVDLVGRTDLVQAASLLRGAAAFVGNDSGLMHLAAALGVPTVGIFGSSNPAWTSPLGERTAVVAARGFACHPCYRRTCNQEVFCLETVAAPAVLAAVDGLLGADDPQRAR